MRDNRRYTGLFGFVKRHPWPIICVALVLAAVSVVYTVRNMEFLTGRDDLMPQNTPFHANYRAWQQEFGAQEDIVVVIESDDQEKAARFADGLYQRLQKNRTVVGSVFYPFGLDIFRKNGILFMPLDDIKGLRRNLTLATPVLKDLSAAPSVQTLFLSLTRQIEEYGGMDGNTPQARQRLAGITFMLDKLEGGFARFDNGKTNFSMNEVFAGNGPDGKESLMESAGRMQILTVLPVKDEKSFVPAEKTVAFIRSEIAALTAKPEFTGVVKAGLTGLPVLEYEEMATSQKDIELATIISVVFTIILLLIAFRGVLNTIAAMVSLVIAICLSFGFATAVIGHLNILSMVFAVMLIGIGVEYGIQLVLRYQEELRQGTERMEAIRIGLEKNIWAIVMAAATVAAAFLTFVFTDFKGFAELGIIAAGGVAICVLITFTVLPAMMVLLAQHRKRGVRSPLTPLSSPLTAHLKRALFGHPKIVIAVTLVLCALCIYPLARLKFDYNLLNLQARGVESVTYAQKLMTNKENGGYFVVATAGSADEAAAKARTLEKLPTVDHVVTLQSFIPEGQEEKLAELRALRDSLAVVKPAPYEENLSLMELPAVFEGFRNAVAGLKTQLEQGKRSEAKPVGRFLATLDKFFAKLEKEKDANAVGMLKDFQGGMFAELPQKIEFLKASLDPKPVTAADIPRELREMFVGKTGKYLLQIAPKERIFDREPLKRFIDDVRSVDPNATGEPVMVYESMTILRDSYRNAFIYAFAAIVVILLVTFRSIKYTLIGLVPLVVGVLFMVGGMFLCGISFNSANIIVMPLVLGIAIDSGIYLINRYRREEGDPVAVVTSSTGVGVFLNTLTIMASFGSLMVAHHQGVFSIGVVMCLGMLACQVAFILVLPAVLAVTGEKRV
ncbi:MAG: MMPL family transporter [Geobacter sp.]|nr:MMPL family transporter [Geobacter sp.]